MKEDRVLFNERIEALKKLDPKSATYEKIYILAAITAAIYDWGVIDTLIKEEEVMI